MAFIAGAEARLHHGPQSGYWDSVRRCNPDLGEAKVYLVLFAGLLLTFLERVLLGLIAKEGVRQCSAFFTC